MREVPAMSECSVNKGKLQLQCKAGFQEPANCPWAAKMLVHLTKSQRCFTTTVWGVAKFGLWLWSSEALSKEKENQKCVSHLSFLCQLSPIEPSICTTDYRWRAGVLAGSNRYVSLRWAILLLQNYDSFKLSVCSTWRFLIHTPLCSPLEAVEMTSWL